MFAIISIVLFIGLSMISTQPVFPILLMIVVMATIFSLIKRLFYRNRIHVSFPSYIEGVRGEDVKVQFTIKNESILSIPNCTIHYKIKNVHSKKVENGFIQTYVGGRKEEVSTQTLQFHSPGILEIEIDYMEIKGFIPYEMNLNGEQSIMIWPKIYPIDSMLDLAESSMMHEDSNQIRQVHTLSDESFGIRPYKMGDSLRQIHWKLSAKLDEIVVLEQHEQVNQHIYLTLESVRNSEEDFDQLNEIFLSVANYFKQQNKKVSIFKNGIEMQLQEISMKDLKLAVLQGSHFDTTNDNLLKITITNKKSSEQTNNRTIQLVDEQQAWGIRRTFIEEDLLKLGRDSIV